MARATGADGLDFWLGTWRVDVGDGKTGTNVVKRILGGRVVRERFSSPLINGWSLSTYDERGGRWLQTWVDDHGGYLLFAGGAEDERFVLYGRRPDGTPSGMRMVFENIADDELDWEWQRTDDGGATWTCLWHIDYVRMDGAPERVAPHGVEATH